MIEHVEGVHQRSDHSISMSVRGAGTMDEKLCSVVNSREFNVAHGLRT